MSKEEIKRHMKEEEAQKGICEVCGEKRLKFMYINGGDHIYQCEVCGTAETFKDGKRLSCIKWR